MKPSWLKLLLHVSQLVFHCYDLILQRNLMFELSLAIWAILTNIFIFKNKFIKINCKFCNEEFDEQCLQLKLHIFKSEFTDKLFTGTSPT